VRFAVVGHVEWVDFLRVDHVPAPGQILHVTDSWAAPAGGGGVAAVVLARAAGACALYTALGDDELGHRAAAELRALGVDVHAVFRAEPQRRAVTHIDPTGERAITVIGARMGPRASDPMPWDEIDGMEAVYVTQGDVGAIRNARRARVVVATSRIVTLLREAAVPLDALVGSASDPAERYDGSISPPPALVVRTAGSSGGTYTVDGVERAYDAAPLPGPIADRYGAGDTFAAALTFALGRGLGSAAAIDEAARTSARSLTLRGAYG
jgi:ribokinase